LYKKKKKEKIKKKKRTKKKKKKGSLSGLANLVQSNTVGQPDKENCSNVVAHLDIKKKKKKKKCLLLCINVKLLFLLSYIYCS
jgi:uncharacterized protein YqhQ